MSSYPESGRKRKHGETQSPSEGKDEAENPILLGAFLQVMGLALLQNYVPLFEQLGTVYGKDIALVMLTGALIAFPKKMSGIIRWAPDYLSDVSWDEKEMCIRHAICGGRRLTVDTLKLVLHGIRKNQHFMWRRPDGSVCYLQLPSDIAENKYGLDSGARITPDLDTLDRLYDLIQPYWATLCVENFPGIFSDMLHALRPGKELAPGEIGERLDIIGAALRVTSVEQYEQLVEGYGKKILPGYISNLAGIAFKRVRIDHVIAAACKRTTQAAGALLCSFGLGLPLIVTKNPTIGPGSTEGLVAKLVKDVSSADFVVISNVMPGPGLITRFLTTPPQYVLVAPSGEDVLYNPKKAVIQPIGTPAGEYRVNEWAPFKDLLHHFSHTPLRAAQAPREEAVEFDIF